MANINNIVQEINTNLPDNNAQRITAQKLRDTLINELYETTEIYDISANNNGTKYANLTAALGTNGANVPEDIRKGGMTISFINSSNDKYEQWLYIGTSTTNTDISNISNWQGVDDEPSAGSDNLTKSGGIAKMDTVGVKKIVEVESNRAIITKYPFKAGKKYVLSYTGRISAAYTSNSAYWGSERVEEVTGIIGTNTTTIFIPSADADYMTFWRTTNGNGTFTLSVPTTETERIENYVKFNITKNIEFDYIGDGQFMSCSDIESQLIKGHTYSVVPTKTTWTVPENSTSYNLNAFAIYYIDENNTTNYLLRSKYPPGSSVMNEPLPTISYITIPDEAVSIHFGFRAITGESVGFILKDITSIVEYVNSHQENSQEITMMYPEKEYLPKVATLKKRVPYNFNAANTRNVPLVLLMFTDIHGDINNFKRIMTWKSKYANYIDDVINAGDTITDNIANYDSVLPSYFAEGGDKVLIALGNHDVCAGGSYKGWSANNTLTIQQVYDKYTALMDTSLNIVKPTSAEIGDISNYANFYYKDYTSGVVSNKPVRLIVLDSCITEASIIKSGTGNDTTATIAYQNAQLNWLVLKLNEANTLGYAVAIMCHSTPAATEKVSPSAFTIYPTSLAIPTDQAASIPITFVEAVNDFISSNGEFICWLVGHTHANHIATITGYDNQLVVGFNTATSRSYGASPTNPYRTGYNGAAPITETTDAFCMVQIDTYYKVVRLVNVGTDYDMYGRKKDMIVINYINREILL